MFLKKDLILLFKNITQHAMDVLFVFLMGAVSYLLTNCNKIRILLNPDLNFH
jgi:hypothetical protein